MRLAASAQPGSPVAGDIVVDSGENNTLTWYNGTAWTSVPVSMLKTADQAANQSSTTFQNVTALVFPLAANTNYAVDAVLHVDSSNTTADFKYTFTAPTGATLWLQGELGAPAAVASVFCHLTSVTGTSCATTVNNANLYLKVRGYVFTAGTAGDLQMQFAQNTGTAASFPVLKQGSWLEVTPQ
jgi:hypothetical protein